MTDTLASILDSILLRGDLAHLALFLWATAATALSWYALREMSRSNRRFEDFIAAIARVDRLIRRQE